jgi:hypothetical protein
MNTPLGMVRGAVLYAVNAYADRVDTRVSIKIVLSQYGLYAHCRCILHSDPIY